MTERERIAALAYNAFAASCKWPQAGWHTLVPMLQAAWLAIADAVLADRLERTVTAVEHMEDTKGEHQMERYIGTKIILAEPQDKDGRSGYRVVYEDGYQSWSPTEAFERAYRRISDAELDLIENHLLKGVISAPRRVE